MSRSARPRLAAAFLLLSLLTSGCAVDRKFFQMDSNSGIPFFGFDLIPRKVSANTPQSSPVDAASIIARGQDR